MPARIRIAIRKLANYLATTYQMVIGFSSLKRLGPSAARRRWASALLKPASWSVPKAWATAAAVKVWAARGPLDLSCLVSGEELTTRLHLQLES
jgi:hypothetical protein